MKGKITRWQYWRDEWIYPFVVAIILASIIRMFIIQPFKIPSTSMFPTLQVGDRIFVNKFIYGAKIPFTDKTTPVIKSPQRGDIVVFVSVTDPVVPEPADEYVRILGPVFINKHTKMPKWYTPRYLVKRLIGLPGDKIEIKRGEIFVNDKLLDKPTAIKNFSYLNQGDFGREGVAITVPNDSYFVLGDNSANSVDSRFWGYVPTNHMTGKVFVIWWPLNRIRLID